MAPPYVYLPLVCPLVHMAAGKGQKNILIGTSKIILRFGKKPPVNVTAELMDIILCYTGAMLQVTAELMDNILGYTGAMLQMRRLTNHGLVSSLHN